MLEFEFMRLALAAGAVVGILAPAVGFFLVQRRQSLTGDGIGHVAFAGVAAGILLDVAPVLTALVFAVLGGIAIELLRSRGGTAGDQALALVFYTGIALGVVLISAAHELNADLFQYLFGSILTVTRSDLVVIAALGAVGLATVGLLYRPLAGVVIDEEGARVAGVPISALNIAVATLAAVTVALAMRVVGILLVAALMVLPVSAAGRVAWSMRSALVLAMAIGLGSALVGLTISYYADLPPGGTIVLVAAGSFGACSLVSVLRGRYAAASEASMLGS
jgi:zinc transport system permease protein